MHTAIVDAVFLTPIAQLMAVSAVAADSGGPGKTRFCNAVPAS